MPLDNLPDQRGARSVENRMNSSSLGLKLTSPRNWMSTSNLTAYEPRSSPSRIRHYSHMPALLTLGQIVAPKLLATRAAGHIAVVADPYSANRLRSLSTATDAGLRRDLGFALASMRFHATNLFASPQFPSDSGKVPLNPLQDGGRGRNSHSQIHARHSVKPNK